MMTTRFHHRGPTSPTQNLPRRPIAASEILEPTDGRCPVCARGELQLRLLKTRRRGELRKLIQAYCKLCGSVGQHEVGPVVEPTV